MAAEISIEDRRSKMSGLLARQGFISLAELSQSLGVSESTVRRDLEILEEQGLIRRTHGGAVYIKDSVGHRLAFADRTTTSAGEKQAIARCVAELIPPGQTIIINGGTTCYDVAKALMGRRLNVITNSVPIAALLSADLETEVTFIGGYIYPRTGVSLGAMAQRQLEGLHATQLVMSCAGLAADGVFNSNQMMVDMERRMMQIAEKVILAADHTKLGQRAVAKQAELDELDVIVTDDGADPARREWLESLGKKVLFAPAGVLAQRRQAGNGAQ